MMGLLRFKKYGHFIEIIGVLLLGVGSFAQTAASASTSTSQASTDTTTSVAGAVRNSKSQKTAHAKKVFTDDDMEATSGPLPKLKMDGAENADDIVVAIASYKQTHTPEQTEDAVRRWYEKYDEELAAAIQDNLDVKTLRAANLSNGYQLCQESQDYEHCRNRQMAEMRGAQHDQTEITSNADLTVRIQHSFMKIRNGLTQNGLHYSWFKIRTTNNIDQF